MKVEYIPKYKIDQVVMLHDEFSSNPAYKTIFIGKIRSIHIHRGEGMFKGEDKRGIYYDIGNYSLGHLRECDLLPYDGISPII